MKIILSLSRVFKGSKYTIGILFVDGKRFCDTLEDPVQPNGIKIYGETAIPAGNYKVKLTYSPRFGKVMPEILNVPNFSGVRIHNGSTASDTEGCVLVGVNSVKGMVTQSRETYKKLMAILETADSIEIHIK